MLCWRAGLASSILLILAQLSPSSRLPLCRTPSLPRRYPSSCLVAGLLTAHQTAGVAFPLGRPPFGNQLPPRGRLPGATVKDGLAVIAALEAGARGGGVVVDALAPGPRILIGAYGRSVAGAGRVTRPGDMGRGTHTYAADARYRRDFVPLLAQGPERDVGGWQEGPHRAPRRATPTAPSPPAAAASAASAGGRHNPPTSHDAGPSTGRASHPHRHHRDTADRSAEDGSTVGDSGRVPHPRHWRQEPDHHSDHYDVDSSPLVPHPRHWDASFPGAPILPAAGGSPPLLLLEPSGAPILAATWTHRQSHGHHGGNGRTGTGWTEVGDGASLINPSPALPLPAASGRLEATPRLLPPSECARLLPAARADVRRLLLPWLAELQAFRLRWLRAALRRWRAAPAPPAPAPAPLGTNGNLRFAWVAWREAMHRRRRMREFARWLADILRRARIRRALELWRRNLPPPRLTWDDVRPRAWRYGRLRWALERLRRRTQQLRACRKLFATARRAALRLSLARWKWRLRMWRRAEGILRQIVCFRRWQHACEAEVSAQRVRAARRLRLLAGLWTAWRLATGHKLFVRALLRRAWWRMAALPPPAALPTPPAPAPAPPPPAPALPYRRRLLCACVEVPYAADVDPSVRRSEIERRARNRSSYAKNVAPWLARRSGSGGASASRETGLVERGALLGRVSLAAGIGSAVRLDAPTDMTASRNQGQLHNHCHLSHHHDGDHCHRTPRQLPSPGGSPDRAPAFLSTAGSRQLAASSLRQLDGMRPTVRRRAIEAARQSYEQDAAAVSRQAPSHRWGFAVDRSGDAAFAADFGSTELSGSAESDHVWKDRCGDCGGVQVGSGVAGAGTAGHVTAGWTADGAAIGHRPASATDRPPKWRRQGPDGAEAKDTRVAGGASPRRSLVSSAAAGGSGLSHSRGLDPQVGSRASSPLRKKGSAPMGSCSAGRYGAPVSTDPSPMHTPAATPARARLTDAGGRARSEVSLLGSVSAARGGEGADGSSMRSWDDQDIDVDGKRSECSGSAEMEGSLPGSAGLERTGQEVARRSGRAATAGRGGPERRTSRTRGDAIASGRAGDGPVMRSSAVASRSGRRHGQLSTPRDRFCHSETHLLRRMVLLLDEAASAGASWTGSDAARTGRAEAGDGAGSAGRAGAPSVAVRDRLWQTLRGPVPGAAMPRGDGRALPTGRVGYRREHARGTGRVVAAGSSGSAAGSRSGGRHAHAVSAGSGAGSASSGAEGELVRWAASERDAWGPAEAARVSARAIEKAGGSAVRVRLAPVVRLPGDAVVMDAEDGHGSGGAGKFHGASGEVRDSTVWLAGRP